MNTFVHLESVRPDDDVVVVQLTDSHLRQRPDEDVGGVRSVDTLLAVLNRMRGQVAAPDFILATGDIADDGSPEAYSRFLQSVGESVPLFAIPGNHDKREAFYSAFGAKAPAGIDAGGWRIVLLDSVVPGSDEGHLGEDQQRRLLDALHHAGKRHILVVIHHPPMNVGVPWLDDLKLQNASWLLDALSVSPNVRAVLSGHVHLEFDERYPRKPATAPNSTPEYIRLMTSPSTCIQFKPGSQEYQLDPIGPGFRCLRLHPDGSITTWVDRVEAA